MRTGLSVLMFLLFASFCATAQADAVFPPLEKIEFDWKKAWGDVSIGSDNDPVIPASRHAIKLSLKNTIQYCLGPNAKASDIKVYVKDINGDAIDDYIVDTSDLKGKISPDCTEALCTDKEGCFVVAYLSGPVSQVFDKEKQQIDACPATAEANTECRPDCKATVKQCPHLFNYDFRISYTKRVKSWNIHAASYFPVGDTAIPSPYLKDGSNIVFDFEQPDKDCYVQETQFNKGKCLKYLQWNGEYSGGYLRDLFRVYMPPASADNALRYTTEAFNTDKSESKVRGKSFGDGYGFNIGKQGSGNDFFALQVPNFETGSDKAKNAFLCMEVRNTADKAYFIPTNSDEELRAFVNNPPEGVTVQACSLRYTDWQGGPFMFGDARVGVLDCGQLSGLPCHTEQELFTERYCMRSSSALTTCDECANGLDIAEITGQHKTSKDGQTKFEPHSVYLSSPPAVDDTGPAVAQYRGTTTGYTYYDALMNALKSNDMPLYENLMAYVKEHRATITAGLSWYMKLYYATIHHSNPEISQAANNLIYGQRVKVLYEETSTCQRSTLCHISVNCTHGASCMPPKVKILMADGTEKAIGEIKVGDVVLGFKADKPLEKLVPGKVAAIKVTDDQPLLGINDTDLTPNHPVLLSNGRVVLANTLGRNDQLVDKDGKSLNMRKITRYKQPTTVFNLDVEGLDGFVANGVRVMDDAIQTKMSGKK